MAGEQLDTPQLQPLAEISHLNGYQGLISAFRARAEQRQIVISGSVNAVAGLPANYIAKLLSPRTPRRVGALSLGPILGVLGLRLLVLPDDDAVQRYDGRIDKHKHVIRAATMEWRVSRRAFREMQAKGRAARWGKMTAEQRTAWAIKLNRIRWSRARKAAKAGANGHNMVGPPDEPAP